MRRIPYSLAAIVPFALLAALSVLLAPALTQAAAQAQAPPGRKLILIPGVVFSALDLTCNPCDARARTVQGSFFSVAARLTASRPAIDGAPAPLLDEDLLSFNYAKDWRGQIARGEAAHYSGEDTRSHLRDYEEGAAWEPGSATLLGEQVRYWMELYPEARFDIVAHSLGGAVAAYWAGTEQDQHVLGAIASITTLDSPVRGFTEGFLPFTVLDPGSGLAGDDLRNEEVAARMQRAAQTVDIFTFANTRDRVVPAWTATLRCPEWITSGCVYRVPGNVHPLDELTHHEAILVHEPTLREVEAILARVPLRWARRITPPPPPLAHDSLALHWSPPACMATPPESCGFPDAFRVQISEDPGFDPELLLLDELLAGGTEFALPPNLRGGRWFARVQARWTQEGGEQHSPFSSVLEFSVSHAGHGTAVRAGRAHPSG